MAGQFDGKVVLVTGAGSGIGRATALAFGREGARVVVDDISVDGGEETARMINEAGGKAIFVKADVTQASEVEVLIKKTIETYGRLDCAFNNAGISGEVAPTADCSLQNWDRVMNTNLRSVFLCMKYEIRQMLKQGGGVIVNTSSVLNLAAHSKNPAYVASKHGVIGLTKSTALAYVKDGIRVNAVCPGNTDTPILEPLKSEFPELLNAVVAATPIGRLASPEEIASAVIWLCSDLASYCIGHALVVDGCYTIQ